MVWIEPLLGHAAPFLLVMFRLLGLFVFTPLLSSTTLPRQAKVLIALAFTAAVYPALAGPALSPRLDLVTLAPLMLSEIMIGASIGLMVSLPLIFMQMGGYLIGYMMGLALAQAYNPELDTDSGVLGQLLFFMGMAAFVAIGGLDAVFLALLDTFASMPLGAFASDTMPLELLVGLLGAGFDFALRLASPVLAVIVMILIAMGFVMKTMPQINIMSVGFSAKILAGLATLAAVIFALDSVIVEEIEGVLNLVRAWAQAPGGG